MGRVTKRTLRQPGHRLGESEAKRSELKTKPEISTQPTTLEVVPTFLPRRKFPERQALTKTPTYMLIQKHLLITNTKYKTSLPQWLRWRQSNKFQLEKEKNQIKSKNFNRSSISHIKATKSITKFLIIWLYLATDTKKKKFREMKLVFFKASGMRDIDIIHMPRGYFKRSVRFVLFFFLHKFTTMCLECPQNILTVTFWGKRSRIPWLCRGTKFSVACPRCPSFRHWSINEGHPLTLDDGLLAVKSP